MFFFKWIEKHHPHICPKVITVDITDIRWLMLSRISRAGLLCRSPSTWLSDVSYSPLLCGAQWLLWAHSISATSSHSSACRVEQNWGTHGRKGWEINAKTTQLLGNQPWVQVQSPLWTQRVLFTSCPSAELQSEDLHKYVTSYSLYLKQRQPAKVTLDKGQWLQKAGHF